MSSISPMRMARLLDQLSGFQIRGRLGGQAATGIRAHRRSSGGVGAFRPRLDHTDFAGHPLEPAYAPLIGFPLAWSPGTSGPVQAEAIYAPLENDADLERFKGKLRGKIVLSMRSRDLAMPTDPPGRRLTDADLNPSIDRARSPNPFRPLGPAH